MPRELGDQDHVNAVPLLQRTSPEDTLNIEEGNSQRSSLSSDCSSTRQLQRESPWLENQTFDASRMSKFYRLMGVGAPFDPSHRFETSWILPPWVLFGIRAIFSLYAFTTLFFIIGWNGTRHDLLDVRQSFSYFTVITYWGLAFYFLFAAIHTFSYALRGEALLNRWPRPLQALQSLYYTTVVTLPFLVTIVFWVVLYKGGWFPKEFLGWSNVSQHALNSVFAAFELFMTRTGLLPGLHVVFLIIILALYLGVAYITYATQGWYTYSFLNPATGGKGRVVAYVFGILAAILVIFAIICFLLWLRKWLTEKVLGFRGKFHGGKPTNEEDMEMGVYSVK